MSCRPFDRVVDAAVIASSCSLENFWKSSKVGVLATIVVSSVSLGFAPCAWTGGGLSVTSICAVHNKCQGCFCAPQHFFTTDPSRALPAHLPQQIKNNLLQF